MSCSQSTFRFTNTEGAQYGGGGNGKDCSCPLALSRPHQSLLLAAFVTVASPSPDVVAYQVTAVETSHQPVLLYLQHPYGKSFLDIQPL